MSACVCQGSVTHGCHSWVLWQCHLHSRHVLFYVSLRLRVCSSRALSHLRALFRVGVWCLDPGTFGFMLEFGHSHSMCPSVSFWEHAVSSSLSRVLFCPRVLCFVVLHAVHVLSAAWIHVIYCAVWHAACFFHGLPAFMLSCLVWTRGLWVFLLAACLCPVLHMAGDLFCWPCACGFVASTWLCLSFLCAMCSHVNLSWPHPSYFLIIG